MANENLLFPATGLDSFTKNGIGVDLANIWNVIQNGSQFKRPQMITVIGTLIGTPATNIVFDLSPVNALFPASTNILIEFISINVSVIVANPIPAHPFTFANIQIPTLGTPSFSAGFIAPITLAGAFINIEMNPLIKEVILTGDPTSFAQFYGHPMLAPSFQQITPLITPVVEFLIANGEYTILQIPRLIIKITELL